MTTRRKFIQHATALATAAAVTPSFLLRPKYKLGLQLYTLREPMAKDLRGTLKKIAALGYEEVETYGFNYGGNKYYWGLEPKVAKQLLNDSNLTTSTGHYDLNKFMNTPVEDLNRYVDQCIEGAHALKQEYITWPWLDPESRTIEKFKILSEKLNLIGETIKKANLQLAYHNHDFEFIDQQGQIGYNIILQETDPSLVKMQMDLYWVMHSSPLKPHDWFKKRPGRFVMWHIKDMDKVNRNLHTEVGNGTIDFKTIFADDSLAGLQHIFVEQGNNLMADPFQSVANSAAYVKKELLK
ncbi:sugar phosphate isomerase/epimerase family protein [Ohtaekwangia koreensis]|nr:sugar phosphate isomerase/epimerase [Ohtaekwangia koreensis]